MTSNSTIQSSSDKTLYFLGGLPKSGTSALAGALYNCGLPMEINTQAGHQPLISPTTTSVKTDGKYHMYESPTLMTLNEQLLRGVVAGFEYQGALVASGIGSMLNPPHPDCIYNDARTFSLAAFILSMVPGFPFGMKDPRFAVLFGTWKRIFELTHPAITLVPIFSVRPPLDAAAALVKRKWMPSMAAALEVWLRYNTHILKWHELYEAKIVIFDSSATYLNQIKILAEMLALNFDEDALKEFYKPSAPPEIDEIHLLEHPMRVCIEDVYDKLLHVQLKEQDLPDRLKTG